MPLFEKTPKKCGYCGAIIETEKEGSMWAEIKLHTLGKRLVLRIDAKEEFAACPDCFNVGANAIYDFLKMSGISPPSPPVEAESEAQEPSAEPAEAAE